LEAATAELRKHGVQLEDAVPAIGGGMLRSFYDPEGNMLQIVQRDNG
jgi:predicted enzyme related to lactoylglutathione lyase